MDVWKHLLHLVRSNPILEDLNADNRKFVVEDLRKLEALILPPKLNTEILSHCVRDEFFTKNGLTLELCQMFSSMYRHNGASQLPAQVQEDLIQFLSCEIKKSFGANLQLLFELLLLLNVVLEGKTSHSNEVYVSLGGPSGSLIKLLESKNTPSKCLIEAARALQLLSYYPPDCVHLVQTMQQCTYPSEVAAVMQKVSLYHLRQLQLEKFSPDETSVLANFSLSILYNLVLCAPNEVLGGSILSVAMPYAFHGLPGSKAHQFKAEDIPLQLDIEISEGDSDSIRKPYTNRNRRKRLRRKRPQPSKAKLDSSPAELDSSPSLFRSLPRFAPPSSPSEVSLKPQWLKSSPSSVAVPAHSMPQLCPPAEDKDHDDQNPENVNLVNGSPASFKRFEVNQVPVNVEESSLDMGTTKFSLADSKVRRLALTLINSIINKAGRQNKFSFWPQMMCQSPSLMTSALRDPSICVRMSALQVINTFLTDSQQVLIMAVDEKDTGPYSTLGKQLGSSIRELHRCLALCLLSERVPAVLVRILKTIELLIENINYSNFKPGLLTKIVTHVKYFLKYKEPVVRANAFSVMVSLLMKRPPPTELKHLLMKYQTPAPQSLCKPPVVRSPPSYDELMAEGEEDFLIGELGAVMLTSEDDITSDSSVDFDQRSTMVSWIIDRCIDPLLLHGGHAVRGMYVQVQLQSLKVLTSLVSEHLLMIKSSIPLIQHVVDVCRKNEDTTSVNKHLASPAETVDPRVSSDPVIVVEHSYILLASLLGSVKYEIEKKDTQSSEEEPLRQEEVVQIWLWALQHPLQPLLHMQENLKKKEKKPTQKEEGGCSIEVEILADRSAIAAAGALSHLCSCAFESIGESWLDEIMETVHFLLTCQDHELRLCGIRIVGFVASYSPVREHVLGPTLIRLTVDLCAIVLNERQNSVNKERILAAWALATVSAVLSFYSDNIDHGSNAPILDNILIVKLLESCIQGCHDKDRIRPHAVRSIGNLVSFLTSDMISDPKIASKLSDVMQTLIDCSSSGSNMKMRWNASYALGNILANSNLRLETASWRSCVILNLSSLTEQFKNFKVRIKSCTALCNVRTREGFGSEFTSVWKSYLQGLENTRNIVDFQEIKHRDELIHQICIGICHLITLLLPEDVESLMDLLTFHKEILISTFEKTNASLPSERASCFIKALQHIKNIEENADVLTLTQQACLSTLCEILNL